MSRKLSYVLRHDPESIGLRLDDGGWVEVKVLLDALAAHGIRLGVDELAEIVATNEKRRFTIEGERIRCAQGHSVPVSLGLSAIQPPARLYHGTPEANVSSIKRRGLVKGTRHHVHLSRDPRSAARVGSRRGRVVVMVVDAAAMARDGYVFYRSANGVWLTDRVPPAYVRPQETAQAAVSDRGRSTTGT
ncbi:MAG TPA: RNA 2'-phosphotransferase [Actinopolymorphaceae bacterium]